MLHDAFDHGGKAMREAIIGLMNLEQNPIPPVETLLRLMLTDRSADIRERACACFAKQNYPDRMDVLFEQLTKGDADLAARHLAPLHSDIVDARAIAAAEAELAAMREAGKTSNFNRFFAMLTLIAHKPSNAGIVFLQGLMDEREAIMKIKRGNRPEPAGHAIFEHLYALLKSHKDPRAIKVAKQFTNS